MRFVGASMAQIGRGSWLEREECLRSAWKDWRQRAGLPDIVRHRDLGISQV